MERVVITGIGVVTPIGSGKEKFWDALCKGENGIDRLTKFDPTSFRSQMAGEVKDFDPVQFMDLKDAKRLPTFIQFAIGCAVMAREDADLDLSSLDLNRVGVSVGSGIGGIEVIEEQHKILLARGPRRVSPFFVPFEIINMAAGKIAIQFGLKGPNLASVTACATSNHAIGEAFRIIQRGDADVMFAGGTEAALTPLSFAGFCSMKALSTRNEDPKHASRPFDRERDGFVMSEGAGVLILESLSHALKREAKIYAELIGYGMSCDAFDMVHPDDEGEGATLSMLNAIRDAGISPEEVEYINAHGTSTPIGDPVETKAIKRTFGLYAYRLPVSSTKSMTGHMLGATGAVELAACLMTISRGIIPPTINYEMPDPECDLDYVPNIPRQREVRIAMSNAFGFGGHNATLIVKRFEG
ncbi:TPA: beta-ketoacyl-[acyl-carrier-protein] synthase II [Candidatus Poribacteria bacterium]|nr:beta-ketoacyl-[acyl-carrier-protein] synthase II [Candidatus Poribacteria bacterium]